MLKTDNFLLWHSYNCIFPFITALSFTAVANRGDGLVIKRLLLKKIGLDIDSIYSIKLVMVP